VGRFEFNSRKPSTFEVNVNRVVSQTLAVEQSAKDDKCEAEFRIRLKF